MWERQGSGRLRGRSSMESQIAGKGKVLAGRAPAGQTRCRTASARHLFTTSPTSLEISSGSTRDANIAWKQSKALRTPPRVSSLAANGPRTATMRCYCFGGWGVANDSMLVWPLKGTNNGTSYAVTSLNLLLETMPEVTVEVVLDSTPMNGNNCKMCLFLLIFTL